ncbi:hypothetical protein NU195Hw_g5641t1 [Hortaea werneckii]
MAANSRNMGLTFGHIFDQRRIPFKCQTRYSGAYIHYTVMKPRECPTSEILEVHFNYSCTATSSRLEASKS